MLKKYRIVLAVVMIGIFAYLTIPHITKVIGDLEALKKERIEQLHCLAQNIYFEARGESIIGQQAVALVTINRTNHPKYPGTICDVVHQAKLNRDGTPILNKCQFSWFCNGKGKSIRNEEKWEQAMETAAYIYDNYDEIEDVTNGAIMYHAAYVRPYWKKSYTKTVEIESHIFYK
jgi:spore germination cell wall hydrolase CwlJ-like protein